MEGGKLTHVGLPNVVSTQPEVPFATSNEDINIPSTTAALTETSVLSAVNMVTETAVQEGEEERGKEGGNEGGREGGNEGGEDGGKETSMQSVSQLSLSRSTPVKTKMRREGGGRRFRPRLPQSSIPLVKTTEQRIMKGETLSIRAIQKPRNSLPILPRRKAKDRQPLIPSKGKIQITP